MFNELSKTDRDEIRNAYHSLERQQKIQFLESLSPEAFDEFWYTDLWLRPNQIVPEGNWSECFFETGRGFGKMLSLETDVPTPNGWTTIGELAVGDELFDENGNICKVLKLHPIDNNPVAYKLTFDDGTTVNACKDHLWLTHTKANRKSYQRAKQPLQPIVKTTQEIVDTLYVPNLAKSEINHSIPCAKPIQYTEKQLPIHPYTLGVWLGDGTTKSGSIESADIDVINLIPYSKHIVPSSISSKSKSSEYRIDGLTKLLKDNDLFNNKHIPIIYLQSSVEQRLELLRGLMDTDGCCNAGGVMEYCTVLPELANNVCELIRSFGIKANVKQNESWLYDKRCKDRYRIHFITQLPVFHLKRKLQNIRKDKSQLTRTTHRYIVKAEPISSIPMRCITVDSPNGLFLITKSFIATHNTVVGADFMATQAKLGNRNLVFVGATYPDLAKVMVKSFCARFPLYDQPKFIAGTNIIRYRDITIDCITLNEDSARGGNWEYAWVDEPIKACDGLNDKIEEAIKVLKFAVRIGECKIIYTSTPKKKPFIKAFEERFANNDPSLVMKFGTMDDNTDLPEKVREQLKLEYANSRFGSQELDGKVDWSADGALWTPELINSTRIVHPKSVNKPYGEALALNIFAAANCVCSIKDKVRILAPQCPVHTESKQCVKYPNPLDFFYRLVVSGDPSMGTSEKSDDFGIVVCGLGKNGHFYGLEDCSAKMGPDQATTTIQRLRMKYSKYGTPAEVVIEKNSMGHWLENALQTKSPGMSGTQTAQVSLGKMNRASYTVILWDQGIGHLVGYMKKLETQMCYFTGENKEKSPDAFDALTMGSKQLMFDKNYNRLDLSSIKGMR